MKPGRNDPCPCGSGTKYKKCCINNDEPKGDDLLWHRQHSMRNGLLKKILKHAVDVYGKESVTEAWNEFHLTEDELFNPESHQVQVFMPWFFYNWTPDGPDSKVTVGAPDVPPARSLLDSKDGRYLDSFERDYIEACLASPFSFFEIIKPNPGNGFELRDIFTEATFYAIEKSGSAHAKAGDILLGKPVTVNGLTTLEACSPFFAPPVYKKFVIDLRKHIEKHFKPITDEDLIEYDIEMIDLYQEFHEWLFNPKMPEIRNTDGDPIVPQSVIYEIESPRIVFDALKDLNPFETEESLLRGATLAPNGELQAVEFQWLRKGHKRNHGAENTVLGQININANKLKVSVNSEKRAALIKDEISKRLETGVRYKTTLIEPIDGQLEKSWNERGSKQAKPTTKEDLSQIPEVKAHLEKMMAAHWDRWVHEKVPALGNKTPVQASKTRDGREVLKSLLTQFERDAVERPQPGVSIETFKKIRVQLGLSDR